MTHFKKLSLIFAAILLSLMPLTGLTSVAAQEDLKEVHLMLDWYPNANHIPIYEAIEKGYFKEAGIDLKIEMPAETNDPIRLVGAKQTDIGISYPGVLSKAIAEGVPVKAIGSLVQQRMDVIMYKTESGIKGAKDLVDKKVGFASDPISEAVVQSMVTNEGEDPSKVDMIDVGWDLIPALATDKVDAVIGAYVNHEYLMLQDQGYNMGYFDFADFGIPESQELIFVASDELIESDPDLLKAFMTALQKGFDAAKEDPEGALEVLFAKEENAYTLDKDIEAKSWEMLQDFMVKDGSFGAMDVDQYDAYVKWLFETGSIAKEVKGADVVHPVLNGEN